MLRVRFSIVALLVALVCVPAVGKAVVPCDVWDLVATPIEHMAGDSGLSDVVATGRNDLCASGWNGFWHWDGTTWTEVPESVPGASYVIRSGGMEIVGGCDIWCASFSSRRARSARGHRDVPNPKGASLDGGPWLSERPWRMS